MHRFQQAMNCSPSTLKKFGKIEKKFDWSKLTPKEILDCVETIKSLLKKKHILNDSTPQKYCNDLQQEIKTIILARYSLYTDSKLLSKWFKSGIVEFPAGPNISVSSLISTSKKINSLNEKIKTEIEKEKELKLRLKGLENKKNKTKAVEKSLERSSQRLLNLKSDTAQEVEKFSHLLTNISFLVAQ